jgi:phage baseplate assembly protein V
MTVEPAAAAFDQRFLGVVIGLVTDVEDPDQIGRVKISLPWYAQGYEEWARVGQMYAGKGYGSTWVPEQHTEVLVAFAHGDMRWPYVVGSLHSDTDTPPEARTSSNDVKTLKTPAGSEIAFDETNGTVTVKTKSGASIKLEEKAGAITLEGTKKIDLTAPEISINGDSKVTISGGSVAIN